MSEKPNYFFYVLECNDNSYYAGYTVSLKLRLAKHNNGVGAKYTRVKKRRPVTLIYYEQYNDKSLALKQEYYFKQLSRKEKENFLLERHVKLPIKIKEKMI